MFLLDGFLFLSPVLVLFLPTEKLLDFSLLVLISGLSGLVAPMAIYSYSNLRGRNVGQGERKRNPSSRNIVIATENAIAKASRKYLG